MRPGAALSPRRSVTNQTKANGTVVTLNGEAGALPLIGTPLAMSEGAFQLRRPPPTLGADGEAVLSEAGYSAERVAALKQTGIVG